MKTIRNSLLALMIILSTQIFAQNKLEVVAEFPSERPGNIAVSPEGRIFITMSALVSNEYMVREILPDGTTIAFPDAQWASQPVTNSGIKGISATIGIQVTADNVLWVLDMGNSHTNPKQNPKLIGWDLATRKLSKVYILPDTVLSPTSFLQDFVIDLKNNTAVIADMTSSMSSTINPAFVVINLNTGYARRVLENNASFLPLDEPILIEGIKVTHKKPDGQSIQPKNALNPIAIDKGNNFIYFGAMGAKKIFRIPTSALADESLTDQEVAKFISYYAEKPISDGFKVGENGRVYVTDIQQNAVGISRPEGYQKLVSDKRLSWPDGLAISNGYLYITANQLNHLPLLNNGVDASKPPYYVFRIKLE